MQLHGTLMKEAACLLERTATMHQATQRHFPEENNIRSLSSLQENFIGSYRKPAQSSSHLLHDDSVPAYTHAFEMVTSIQCLARSFVYFPCLQCVLHMPHNSVSF